MAFRKGATLILEIDSGFSTVKSLQTPVLLLASALQLALNLLDLSYIFCSKRNLAVGDYEQHVNERVSWNVYQFSEHVLPSWSELKIDIWCSQFDCQMSALANR